MKRFLLAILLTAPLIAGAQEALQNESKYGATLKLFMKMKQKKNSETNGFLDLVRRSQGIKSVAGNNVSSERTNLVVHCNESSSSVAKELEDMGFDARPITHTCLTVNLPIDQIETLAGLSSVKKINGMTPWHNNNKNARAYSNVEMVHAGRRLDTPFKGKGVVIGVIDQGIQYDHAAFRVGNDSTRVLASWNLTKSMVPQPYVGSAAVIASGNDGMDESHGTHVAGIAAGGDMGGLTEYYGMAPEANLVLVSTDMEDADYLNGIDYVKKLARERNAPWVVNMSLGSNFHAHDGTSDNSLMCDSILEDGGIIIAAAGNEGDVPMHVSGTFEKEGDSLFALVDPDGSAFLLYSVTTDDTPYKMQPYIYNSKTNTMRAVSIAQWIRYGQSSVGIDDVNNRYSGLMYVSTSNIIADDEYFVAVFVGTKAGQTIDCWTHSSSVVFKRLGAKFMAPDMVKNICSPAEARSVIAVGSYASAENWTAYSGGQYSYRSGVTVGSVSSFSSRGPTMDPTLLKPDVSAPGQPIVSSVNTKHSDYADDKNALLVNRYTFDGKTYSYGVMQGTSMASPHVAGVVALWLQANPNLTNEQVRQIIRTTSTMPAGYNAGEWNPDYGYGRIDAYEGIKEALNIKNAIHAVHNSTEPLTFLMGDRQWKLLFNSTESYARINLYSLDGRLLQQRTIQNAQTGQEETLDLSGLPAGIYMVNIQTPQGNITRKVAVQ